jgi:hypothetical protein
MSKAMKLFVEKMLQKKRMGATNVGVCRTHPLFVVTVLTPATTETEDSPAVSSCPTIYIATRVPCKAVLFEEYEDTNLLCSSQHAPLRQPKLAQLLDKNSVNISKVGRKIFTMSQSQRPTPFE